MSKPRIFISYRRSDADIAGKMETALERLGFEALNPVREMRAGEDLRKEIQAAIKRSDALILLAVTPDFLSSSWMSYEAGVAAALGKRVMVLLPSKYPVAELPAEIASNQIVDFDPQAPERAAHDIAARLAAV